MTVAAMQIGGLNLICNPLEIPALQDKISPL
jgi:hypothetical protein